MPDTETGGGVVNQAQTTVGQVVDQAQQTAGQVTGQAKQQASSQLESQKGRLVDTLGSVSHALRQTGQQLDNQQQGAVAGYLNRTAVQVERTTNYLRTRDVHELVEDTQRLARREPALFLAGALALGFVGARFLMSSGQRGQQAIPAAGQSLTAQTAPGSGSGIVPARRPMAYPETSVSGASRNPARSTGPTAAVAGQAERVTAPPVSAPLGTPDMPRARSGRTDALEPPVA